MVNNPLLARLARQGGGKLLDMAVGKLFGGAPAKVAGKDSGKVPGATIAGKAAKAAAAQMARRSVPAAIVIGGAVLAKHLYDKRRAKRAERTDDQA